MDLTWDRGLPPGSGVTATTATLERLVALVEALRSEAHLYKGSGSVCPDHGRFAIRAGSYSCPTCEMEAAQFETLPKCEGVTSQERIDAAQEAGK